MRALAPVFAALALGVGGCVNGVRSGTPLAVAPPPAAVSTAPAAQPPPPPEPPKPSAAPLVWRAEYYKISDG